MNTLQEGRNRSTESVMATHGSLSDAHLPTPSKESCQKESLPSEATVLEDLSNAFSGMTAFHPDSTSSALPHALSPRTPKEEEEVSEKIDQAKDAIRDFQKAFYHQNGTEKLGPSSITAERNVAEDSQHSKRA